MQAAGDDELVKAEMCDFLSSRALRCQQDGKQTTYRHMAVPSEQVAACSSQCEKLAFRSGLETDEQTAPRDVHIPYNKDQNSPWLAFFFFYLKKLYQL